jgi:electron transport complex protein RnfC
MSLIASDSQAQLAYNANSPGRETYSTPGGIHPNENKSQSVQTPIEKAPIPPVLTFPLSQHIGAPAKPIVTIGEHVLKGQKIAEAQGFVSVPIHASSSGTVVAIENRPIAHASGFDAMCVVIETDGKDTWIERQGAEDFSSLEKHELIQRIRNAGIAGMGGAGFPAAVKLNTREDQSIESLIINGTECEPFITSDDILMRERAEQIIQGTLILKQLIQPSIETVIGVEDNKPEGILALRSAAQGTGIEIVSFPTKYPSGGEKQLIQIITGKEVPSGGLPAEVGVVCQNLGSTAAIYQAIVLGEPLISRITTVTGNAVQRQQNFEVLLGSPMSTLLDICGYDESKASRLIMGGPMMGFALPSKELPIVKTTNCLLAPTPAELAPPSPAQACIRCGMCAEACPASLLPQQMYWFSRAKNHEALLDHNLMDCIECGACSFSCPSNIPLVQYYRSSKADIRKAEAEAKKAEYSMARYEARLERLEKAEAEKEAKRKERQEKAAAAAKAKEEAAAAKANEESVENPINSPAEDPVAAAIARAKAKADGIASDPTQEAKDKLASLEKRLKKAQDKLQSAIDTNDDNVEAFKNSVVKLEEKVNAAQSSIPASSSNKTEPSLSNDDPVARLLLELRQKQRAHPTH